MRPQKDLLDAQRKLEEARKGLIREILAAVAEADDYRLAKVAAVFWPESKKKPKKKPVHSVTVASKKKPVHLVQTVTTASKKNAAVGRAAVARGERPPLKTAILSVMGKRTMNAFMIVDALKAKGWLPASSDPRQYVSYMLSRNTPRTFERTKKRGFYRVRTSPIKVTTKQVWAIIRSKAQSSFTLVELATWVGCEMNQLRSIVFNLQQRRKLTRDRAKRPFVYRIPSHERLSVSKPLLGDPKTDSKLAAMFEIDVATSPHAKAGAKSGVSPEEPS